MVPRQVVVGQFLKTFEEFPQRQKSASFNVDQILQRMQKDERWGSERASGAPVVMDETPGRNESWKHHFRNCLAN